jgi:hypothetical protein
MREESQTSIINEGCQDFLLLLFSMLIWPVYSSIQAASGATAMTFFQGEKT